MRFILIIALVFPLLAQKGPAPVIEGVKKACPKCVINTVKKEKEKGQTVYEVETKEGAISRDFMVKPDGSILESEESIDASTLPKAVADAIKAAHPKATIQLAEKLTRGTEVLYEIALKDGGKKLSLTLDSAGKAQK